MSREWTGAWCAVQLIEDKCGLFIGLLSPAKQQFWKHIYSHEFVFEVKLVRVFVRANY